MSSNPPIWKRAKFGRAPLPGPESDALTKKVREFWEREACGTRREFTGASAPWTREWFERIEAHRRATEPFIPQVARFGEAAGKDLLEVGVGAGADHLQFARAGANCHGVDLTETAVDATRAHLAIHGFTSHLQRANAEDLPYPDRSFDIVYSWGVIHHTARPDRVAREIRRVLRPGGVFRGMMYHRHSLVGLQLWGYYGLLRLRPWRSLSYLFWNHHESVGTKAYAVSEIRSLFREAGFKDVEVKPVLTSYDLRGLFPRRFWWRILPHRWGLFAGIQAVA